MDAYTITRNFNELNSMNGRTVAIVGDIKHSRVARSDIDVFTRLGAKVVLVAPTAFLPSSLDGWGVSTADSLDDVIGVVDVVYMLRIQRERMDAAQMPSLREYSSLFALTPERAARMQTHALLLHPGPINRGVEMIVDPSLVPGSRRCVWRSTKPDETKHPLASRTMSPLSASRCEGCLGGSHGFLAKFARWVGSIDS